MCQPPSIVEYPKEPLFDVFANFERFVNPKPTPGLTLLFSSNRPLPAKPSKKKKPATITPTLEDFKTNFHGEHLHLHPCIYARSTLQVPSIPNAGFTSGIFEGIPEPLFKNVRTATRPEPASKIYGIDSHRSLSRVAPSWPASCRHLRIMQSLRVSNTTRHCTVVRNVLSHPAPAPVHVCWCVNANANVFLQIRSGTSLILSAISFLWYFNYSYIFFIATITQ
jgi:hypothetical protein